MRVLNIRISDFESAAPGDHEEIEFHLYQEEQEELLYFDLTLACMLTEVLKPAVRFSDFDKRGRSRVLTHFVAELPFARRRADEGVPLNLEILSIDYLIKTAGKIFDRILKVVKGTLKNFEF